MTEAEEQARNGYRTMKPKFFATPADWRRWLEKNHDKEAELIVGFYKRDSGKPSITWPESVDQALCFGWIDGVRRSIDNESYCIRFTPRKARSAWSSVNIKRVAELAEQGLMHASGTAAFERRTGERSGIYSFEQLQVEFEPAQLKEFRRNKPAWKFFQSQPAWYRRTTTWWVISAKKPETRKRRLASLMEASSHGAPIRQLDRTPKGPASKKEPE